MTTEHALEAENDRLRQDRRDVLSICTLDGLIASDWVARVGKAERRVKELESALLKWQLGEGDTEMEARVKELEAENARLTGILRGLRTRLKGQQLIASSNVEWLDARMGKEGDRG
jgi:hypothetical protein